MEDHRRWVIDLTSHLIAGSSESEGERKKCIYRVPKFIRDLNEEAYDPKLVSYGPYHHGKAHLMPMERHKFQFLADYLERAGKTPAQVVEAFRPVVQDLMDSYESLEEPWTDKGRFLELMIVDGCFLLQMNVKTRSTTKIWRGYMARELWMDQMRLENQLPLLVISILIENGGHQVEDTAAFLRAFDFDPAGRQTIRGLGRHLLDFAKTCRTISGGYFYDHYWTVKPAMKLFQAGVRFKRNETGCYNDISFTNGVLRLPYVFYHSNTEAYLLNCTTYENLHEGTGHAVTQFVLFMDNIINTDKDVALLREQKIISCSKRSDREIASLFNRLSKRLVAFQPTTKDESVNKNLVLYCFQRRHKWRAIWHKWRASFMQTYLTSPWVFSSLVAAFILMVLTILQTTYTIMAYYKKP